jgi:hypothetical protein
VNEQYFYCYSPRLKERLLAEGERFICVGLNESTGKKFWLFPQTERLGEVLTDWKARRQVR